MRGMTEVGLSLENCETWYERSVALALAVVIVVLVVRVRTLT